MLDEQESLTEAEEVRTLYLPLQELDKCSVCARAEGKLKLCPACGEIIYCSQECQTKDWPAHKIACGKTDRIDLEKFYPFLAFLAEASHFDTAIPRHIAQAHFILRYPNPGDPIVTFPDQSSAQLVLLAEDFPRDPYDTRPALTDPDEVNCWWPEADPEVRESLCSMLRREGYTVPILLSICISLMTDIYSTTHTQKPASPAKRARRRTRLRYKGSPISDFGLVECKVRDTNSPRHAYYCIPSGPLELGPDPAKHFALYFSTLRGEEAYIDFNLFPFGITTSVQNAGYTELMPLHLANGPLQSAPALFIDKNTEADTSHLIVGRKYSALRNEVIQKATVPVWPKPNWNALAAVVESIVGKQCTQDDIQLLKGWTEDAVGSLSLMLDRRGWENWPREPVIDNGSGNQRKEGSGKERVDWVDFVQEVCRRNEQGVIDCGLLEDAFQEFKKRQHISLESSRQPEFISFGTLGPSVIV